MHGSRHGGASTHWLPALSGMSPMSMCSTTVLYVRTCKQHASPSENGGSIYSHFTLRTCSSDMCSRYDIGYIDLRTHMHVGTMLHAHGSANGFQTDCLHSHDMHGARFSVECEVHCCTKLAYRRWC